MPLPVGHRVAEKAQRRFDFGQASIRPTGPAGFALTKATAVVAKNFVARPGMGSVNAERKHVRRDALHGVGAVKEMYLECFACFSTPLR
jgi:hypothetical protein